MYKTLRALLALSLIAGILLCAVPTSFATDLVYSMSEKFEKQLEAGSGFAGTLSVSFTAVPGQEAKALTTKSPLVFDVTYLYALENAASKTPAERRMTLQYPSGANSLASLALSMKAGSAYLKSNLLPQEGWYQIQSPAPIEIKGPAEAAATAATETPSEPAAEPLAVESLLENSLMPSLFTFLSTLGTQTQALDSHELTEALAPYTTKIDVWIESYRQSAVLGKLEDGTTTMQVNYAISPAALKAQLKQMVLDLLSDGNLLPKLQALLPASQSAALLSPAMQSYYFYAIDKLPLEGDMTISRTVSLKGDTLALQMRLPFYDKDAGAVTLRYSRAAGLGDLPDENVISVENDHLTLRLEYQEYSTMTDVTVYQGTLLREPRGLASYAVDEGAADAQKTVSASFTLTRTLSNTTDENGLETMAHKFELSLEPLLSKEDDAGEPQPLTATEQESFFQFPPLTVVADLAFASKAAKNASTSISAGLTLSGETLPQVLELKLEGKTKAKWDLDAFATDGLPSLSSLKEEELAGLLASLALKGGAVFLPQFHLPEPDPTASPAPAPTDSPVPAN